MMFTNSSSNNTGEFLLENDTYRCIILQMIFPNAHYTADTFTEIKRAYLSFYCHVKHIKMLSLWNPN